MAFRRALRKLRRKGEISAQEERRYWVAATTTEKIEHNHKKAVLIDHLQDECEKLARASGDFRDDLIDWWNRAVAWIVDNWKTVLQVLLTLVVVLETPEQI